MTFLSLFNRKSDEAPRAPSAKAGHGARGKATPKPGSHLTVVRPSSAPVAVAAPSRHRQGAVRAFKGMDDLPKFNAIESRPSGKFPLSENARRVIAILASAETPNGYIVIGTQDTVTSAVWSGVVTRIQAAGGTIVAYGHVDSGILHHLYKDTEVQTADDTESDIKRSIEQMVEQALSRDASDIHIEKRGGKACVRFRIDGDLEKTTDGWDPEYAERFARALFAIADDESKDTSFSTRTQFSVSLTVSGGTRVQRVKLRVQISPCYPDGGMDVVIRILRVGAESRVRTLEELGYAPDHVEMLTHAASSPSGIMMIAGTTGSGKSTTLQTMMHDIGGQSPDLKMISIEDPPEYELKNVTQIPVPRRKVDDEKGVNPFVSAMKDTMRMDPDVLMVGEIRDPESAGLMVGMVLTGHKVLSTLHAGSAFVILERLVKMGVDLETLASRGFISGLVYQKLVRMLCPECKVEYSPSIELHKPKIHERIKAVTKEGDPLYVKRDGGCEYCNHKGTKGRTVCAEIVIPDSHMLDCIRRGDLTKAYDHWRSAHRTNDEQMLGRSALDHAILKMRRGEVSPLDVERDLGLLTGYSYDDALSGGVAEELDALAR